MAEEKNYETKIRKLLDSIRAYNVKYFGCGFTQAGVPDILSCVSGWFVAIEVKASRGKPSALQLHNLRKINESFGYAILAYPEDWGQLQAFLTALADKRIGEANRIYYDYFRCRFLD